MAAPTVLGAYSDTPQYAGGTMTWTATQGAGVAIASVLMRKSQYISTLGDWGGVSVVSEQVESGGGGSVSGRLGYITDLTGKSGDTRSAYEQYSDWRWFADVVLAHESESELVLVDSAKWEAENAGAATRVITLDPAGYDCIAVFAILQGGGTSLGTTSAPYDTATQQYYDFRESCRIKLVTAEHLAADGPGNYEQTFAATSDQILLGLLLGVVPTSDAGLTPGLVGPFGGQQVRAKRPIDS